MSQIKKRINRHPKTIEGIKKAKAHLKKMAKKGLIPTIAELTLTSGVCSPILTPIRNDWMAKNPDIVEECRKNVKQHRRNPVKAAEEATAQELIRKRLDDLEIPMISEITETSKISPWRAYRIRRKLILEQIENGRRQWAEENHNGSRVFRVGKRSRTIKIEEKIKRMIRKSVVPNLSEIAREFNVSRERVRQIAVPYDRAIKELQGR